MFEKLQKIVAEQMGVEPEKIMETTMMENDLQADQIDLYNIWGALVEEFDLDIPSDEMYKWVTVKDIMDTLRENGITE